MRKRMLFLLKIQNFFFGPNLTRLTNYQNKKWNLKNLVLLLFGIYGKMIWCKNPSKPNKAFLRKTRHRRTDDGQTANFKRPLPAVQEIEKHQSKKKIYSLTKNQEFPNLSGILGIPNQTHQKKMFIRCFSVSNVYQYQKLTSSLTFFLIYCKDFLFGYFEHDWPYPPKLIASTCRKVCLSACKKSTLSLLYFLRYCKDLVKLLFWVVWACLAMTTKNDNMSLQKTMFTSCKILTFYSKYR